MTTARRIGDCPDMKMKPQVIRSKAAVAYSPEIARGLMADLACAVSAKVAKLPNPAPHAQVKAAILDTLNEHVTGRLNQQPPPDYVIAIGE